MKTFELNRYALSVAVAVAFLAGCGGSQLPVGAPGAAPQGSTLTVRPSSTYNYKVLYSFGAAPDGSQPRGSLIDVGGTLYGVTENGGANLACGYSSTHSLRCGTVFSITTGGTEKVLYSFGAPPDGDEPVASLLDVSGTLYGTTNEGGANKCAFQAYYFGCGTVFRITTSGTEKVLYSFAAPFQRTDGFAPAAPLIKMKGLLYGTTARGGKQRIHCGIYSGGCGTVFSITTSGTEKVLHNFGRGGGQVPVAGLIDVNGKLYGTTYGGGGGVACRSTPGCGTVFSITTSGKEKILHRFDRASQSDGAHPHAALLDLGGTLYGTTVDGGAHNEGTVFSITTGGTEKVLHSFGTASDGRYPVASLIEVKGVLYGTTQLGGANAEGTVFSMATDGTETVLHDFSYAGYDGINPDGLIDVGGTLYGITINGGTYGNGTVFTLTP